MGSLFKTLNLCSYQSSLHSRKCLNKTIQLSICKTKHIQTLPLICPQHIQDMPRICPTQHPQVKMPQLWSWALNLLTQFVKTVSRRFPQELTQVFLVQVGLGQSFAVFEDLGLPVVWSIVYQVSENTPMVVPVAMLSLEKLNPSILADTWQLLRSLFFWCCSYSCCISSQIN